MVDVKDVSKNDIIKRQDPPQTLKKENKMLWFLRKVPFLKIDELVSSNSLMINFFFNLIKNFIETKTSWLYVV